MEEKMWSEHEIAEKEKSEKEPVMEEEKQHSPKGAEILQGESVLESRLRGAALQIVPDEAAKERMMEGVKTGRYGRRRLAPGISAAVFAACLFLSLLCFFKLGVIGEDVVVYAATEEHGWQKLKEGERILLKMEPFDTAGESGDIGDFDEDGYPCYYPYICTFRLEVPENCLYDRDFITLGDDSIAERGGKIEWWVAPDRPENVGKTKRGSLTLWLVSDNIVKARRERLRGYELELTKEDGKCYAELKRVWESKAYKKSRHKK